MQTPERAWCPRPLAVGLLVGALVCPTALQARIDLFTVPPRERTELSIYNAADLTLVRETRPLSLSEGPNEVQFSWANTLIDPTSLRINVDNYPELTVLDAVYPPGTSEVIVWNIEADQDTHAMVEISYFISGITWVGKYNAQANADETALSLQQFTTVRNRSGEDFVNATTRLVVGDVNIVDLIADLARRGIQVDQKVLASRLMMTRESAVAPAMDAFGLAEALPAAAPAQMRREAAEIIRQAVSELHVLAIEGEEDIFDGWGKELPSPVTDNIPFDLSYEIHVERFGPMPVKVYKFKNDEDHNLGTDPLPKGTYYVYSESHDDGLRLESVLERDYIAIGDDVELVLGADGLVLYEPRVMSMKRENFSFHSQGQVHTYEEVREVELEIKNTRDREIPLKLTKHVPGEWEFREVSHPDYERLGTNTVRWELTLDPKSTTTITYTVAEKRGDGVVPLRR